MDGILLVEFKIAKSILFTVMTFHTLSVKQILLGLLLSSSQGTSTKQKFLT